MSLSLTAALLLLVLLIMTVYNGLTAPRLQDAPASAAPLPLCSVLIPARDESANLRRYLPSLLRSQGVALELLILDDHSTDDTRAVAEALCAQAPFPARVLRGAPLPPGWLGKNWACHQLAQAARGELLIFCDADVEVSAHAVRRTAVMMVAGALDALTVLPLQRMGTAAEAAALPFIMHLPLLGMLPLREILTAPSPKLAVANGQWFAFTRRCYQDIGGHAAVRDQVVEDVALAVNVKGLGVRAKGAAGRLRHPFEGWVRPPSGRRLLPVLAVEDLQVRMYRGAGELQRGFGKNLYLLLGGHPGVLLLFVATFCLTMLMPLLLPLLHPSGLLPLALLLALRLCTLRITRAPWRSLLLHPVGALWVLGMVLRSAYLLRRGEVRWKGRTVVLPT